MAFKRAFDEVFINATTYIVANCGIENLRTKDVADYAGFSEATLFRAFETKEGLLRRTFLKIDKQISDILTQSDYIQHPDDTPFDLAIYAIWHKVYRYLIDNRNETIFLIRYRYSSLYTDEIRSMREAYNGGFDEAYKLLEAKLGDFMKWKKNFLFNYIFEMTLCFVEKVITGKLEDTEETELHAWNVVSNVVREKDLVPGNS